jgi:hypothetical protein
MIDKICLQTKQFKIGKHFFLNSKNQKEENSTQPNLHYKNTNGHLVSGPMAFLSRDGITASTNQIGLLVQFNPSQLIYGHNYNLISQSQLNEACARVQSKLIELGVYVDLNNMIVSRIDIAKNILGDKPFGAYKTLFNFLYTNRLSRSNYPEYPTTYGFSNKCRSIIFYDKLEQLKKKGISNSELNIDNNAVIIRCEYQAKKAKIVKRDLQINKLTELLEPETFKHLEQRFSEIVKKLIFKGGRVYSKIEGIGSEIDFLKHLKKMYSRNTILKFLASLNLDEIIERFDTLDNFANVLAGAGFERTHVYRILIEMQDLMKSKGQFRVNENSISALYNELTTKLFN